jgi:hypothetical protein
LLNGSKARLYNTVEEAINAAVKYCWKGGSDENDDRKIEWFKEYK